MQTLATIWADEQYTDTRCIGRMTSEAGKRVTIDETTFRDGTANEYAVQINGKEVFTGENKGIAIRVARWWMDGCPC